MAVGIDILHLFPGLAAIGRQQLQAYCNEWLNRPIARYYARAQITIDADLQMNISVDASGPVMREDRVFSPIDELCHRAFENRPVLTREIPLDLAQRRRRSQSTWMKSKPSRPENRSKPEDHVIITPAGSHMPAGGRFEMHSLFLLFW